MEAGGTPGSRATVCDSPDGLEIVIPAPRIWIAIGFLGPWLAGWSLGEVSALRALLQPAPPPALGFLAVWLALWTLGGSLALSLCAWLLVGHECVRLRADALTIRREAFGIGPLKTYDLARITDLRALPMPEIRVAVARGRTAPATGEARTLTAGQVAALRSAVGIGGPGIVFDYRGRRVLFGVALDPLEARQVVVQLQSRHAFAQGPGAESPAA
jgi:hypothetical protein